jgi:hypothetical protein
VGTSDHKVAAFFAPPPYAAVFVSDDIPASMTAGQQVTVHVTFRNTGSNVWTRADLYRLGSPGNSDPFFASARVLLASSASVGNGQTYTFTFTMKAPGTAGSYVTDWRMLREGVTWFGATLSKTVTVTPPPNAAIIVSNDMPTSMTRGQTYTVHVTVQNSGTMTWTAALNYRLGFVGDKPPFGPGRIVLGPSASVAPGQQYIFTFTVTAPNTPGTYTMRYRMLREGIAWFGQTTTTTITVQ